MILAINAASAGFHAAMVEGETLRGAVREEAQRGLPERLAAAVAALIETHGAPDLVAVVTGPGSFTGLRATLALAHGIAAGCGIPVIGVSLTEALREALPALGGRTLWVASHARPGRIFLDRGAGPEAFALTDIPAASGRIAVAGDCAIAVTASLAARGADVMLSSARQALPRLVALVAARRHAGELPPCPAMPLYGEPPEAKLPRGGLRPAPLPASPPGAA